MKVQQNKGALRPIGGEPVAAGRAPLVMDWTASQVAADVLDQLLEDKARYVAQAPGRLDVMGGSAEYTGSLVLNLTTADHVLVAVQPRDDSSLSISSCKSVEGNGDTPFRITLDALRRADGSVIDAERGRSLVGGPGAGFVTAMVGALAEALRGGVLHDLGAGLSIVVGSTMADLADAGELTATVAASLVAVGRSLSVRLEPTQVVDVCRRVQRDWLLMPVSAGDATCVCLGEAHGLTQYHGGCRPQATLPLPDDLLFIGMDCGPPHPDSRRKYECVRTASFMGREVIDRIIQHDGAGPRGWDGQLSRLSVSDYVERFRDRIPTKLKGSVYLDHFGQIDDRLAPVDPGTIYKVRSRTEHHIYEHARTTQFVECLSRAVRTGDEKALFDAGELMYASHWSYGQRCGLGGVKTDLLVNAIRQQARDSDIYGAKISGPGWGGVVTVFLRATDRSSRALDAAREAYRAKTGSFPRLVQGSIPGCLMAGARQV